MRFCVVAPVIALFALTQPAFATRKSQENDSSHKATHLSVAAKHRAQRSAAAWRHRGGGEDVTRAVPAVGFGFCGNMDVQLWANGSFGEIKAAVLTKLNAAKGGGFIFQSDHSVPGDVSGERYDYVLRLVRQYGTYPLKLGEYDLADF